VAEDVEVAQQDQVRRPGRLVQRAAAQELGDVLDLGHALRVVGDARAVEDVDGAQHKARPARLKAADERRAGDLRHGLVDGLALVVPGLERRQDQLAGQPAEAHLARIVEEGHPLVVARLALGHIGDQVLPVIAQNLLKAVQRLEVFAHLLDGHQVKAGDDLGDVVERFRQALAVGGRIELADVPGRQEQVVEQGARGRHVTVKLAAQGQQPLGDAPVFGLINGVKIAVLGHAGIPLSGGSAGGDGSHSIIEKAP